MNVKFFKEHKYCIVRNVIDTKEVWEKTKQNIDKGTNDTQVPGSASFYRDIEICKFHIKLLPILEKETGLKLYPTYTYHRIYKPGAVLNRHTDRPACEISASLCLGYEGNYIWPLWLNDGQTGYEIETILNPGDMLIYRGCEVEHWRETYEHGILHGAAFLHYVDQEGPYADCIYDMMKL